MPRSLAVFLLAIAATLATIWCWPDAGGFSPEPGSDAAPLERSGGTATDAESPSRADRTAVEPVPAAKPATEGGEASADRGRGKPSAPQPAEPPPGIRFLVRSRATNEPIPAFRVTFRDRTGTTLRVEGSNGEALLGLRPGQSGRALLESDGYSPRVLECGDPPRAIDLFLDPTPIATGIELRLRDPDFEPIGHVRVQAFRLASEEVGAAPGPATRRPLWSRRAEAPDGHYPLPALEPGRYALRVSALEADGSPRPLQPFRRVYVLTGSNGFVEDVVLEPGCLLTLDLVDRNSAPLDVEAHEVTLDLRPIGTPRLSRLWHARVSGEDLAALDRPPAPGPCRLDEAIAPGRYALTVRIDDAVRLDRHPLFLRAGERQTERLFVDPPR